MNDETGTALDVARAALSAVVMAYVRLIIAAAPDSAKMLRMCQTMRRAVVRQCRVHAKLFAMELRETLSQTPALRARIIRELGGHMALVNWEVRRRGAKLMAENLAARRARGEIAEFQPKSKPVTPSASPRLPRKRWQPKTDRHGHFRLAAISMGKRPRTQNLRPKIKRRRPAHIRSWVFHPVQTTPDDLRVNVYFDDPYPAPAKTGRASAGYAPPIERPPI